MSMLFVARYMFCNNFNCLCLQTWFSLLKREWCALLSLSLFHSLPFSLSFSISIDPSLISQFFLPPSFDRFRLSPALYVYDYERLTDGCVSVLGGGGGGALVWFTLLIGLRGQSKRAFNFGSTQVNGLRFGRTNIC